MDDNQRASGGGEEIIDKTKVFLWKLVVLDGATGWHRMSTTNLMVGLLARQGADCDRTS